MIKNIWKYKQTLKANVQRRCRQIDSVNYD